MFKFFQGTGRVQRLDAIIQRIEMNASNNYKDAAQSCLRELEAAFKDLEDAGKLSEKQKAYYQEKLSSFQIQMKNFTHKDQKATWV